MRRGNRSSVALRKRPIAHSAAVALLLVSAFALRGNSQSIRAPQQDQQQDQPAAQVLRSQTSLVLVRAVVRDAHGNPVAGLNKDDFKLFDNKKQQRILFFEAERPADSKPPTPSSTAAALPNVLQPPVAPPLEAAPQKFTALFFDDYHIEFGNLVRVREAAERYLKKSLDGGERVAIFSSSGKPRVEFTNDRARLEEALSQLHVDTRFEPKVCPKLPAQFAQSVADDIPLDPKSGGSGASGGLTLPGLEPTASPSDPTGYRPLRIAEAMAAKDNCPVSTASPDQDMQTRASNMVLENDLGVRVVFDDLEMLLGSMASTPGGQRTMAVISDGFFDRNLQYRMDALIDKALRAGVVINSLDSRGLYAEPPGGDLSERAGDPQLQIKIESITHASNQSITDPLNEVAVATGGVFVQNTNDLDAGVAKVSGRAGESYLLGFAPEELRADGRFHSLSVKLSSASSSHSQVQARPGYFAPQKNGGPGTMASRIEEATFSSEKLESIPVQISTMFGRVSANSVILNVTVGADMRSVQFARQGDRFSNDVTMLVAVFDPDGNYVTSKEEIVKLRLPDAGLQQLRRTGGETILEIPVKLGAYSLRAVVGESNTGQIGSATANIKTP
jgi:VWFA-related protein